MTPEVQLIARIVIGTLGVYTFFASFIRDIRLFYCRNTPTKMGGISYFGLSVSLWVMFVAFSGFVAVQHPLVWYFLALFGLFISFIGYVIDSV